MQECGAAWWPALIEACVVAGYRRSSGLYACGAGALQPGQGAVRALLLGQPEALTTDARDVGALVLTARGWHDHLQTVAPGKPILIVLDDDGSSP